MTCIYCSNQKLEDFKGREHVIPQSFGTFGDSTPVLNCVCDGCNAYFSKNLDELLSRHTLEGITRYKKGISSREKRKQQGIRFLLDKGDETGEYAGILVEGVDSQTGKLGGPVPQVHFLNTQTNKYEAIPIEKIAGLDLKGLGYSDKGMKVFGPSKEQHAAVVEELKKIGINFQHKSFFAPPPFLKAGENAKVTLPVIVEGTIDNQRKWALVKILVNFAAFYLGTEEVLKSQWDKARHFVRQEGQTILGRLSQKPFWDGQETENLRFTDDSYNLRIENQIVKGKPGVAGVIQFYNLFTYEFVLAENYRIPEGKEVAMRFKPGEPPMRGGKFKAVNLNGTKIPLM